MRKNSVLLILAGIVLVASLLRLAFLSEVPNGFQFDEAYNGYEAYSILKTGHDQYGKFLPLFVRAGGDFRESSYIFLAVPFVGIFGLNEFAARLPAAIFGILTVIILYFLVKEFFGEKFALTAALLLAINPWHVEFSRVALRAILFPFFFSAGLLCFLKALKKPVHLIPSAIIFSLSLYTYFPARVFVPLFLLGLAVIFFDELKSFKKSAFAACIIMLSFFIPLFSFWISAEGMARARETVILSFQHAIHSYIYYFSPIFLFNGEGANIIFNIPGIGKLHTFESITVLAGLIGVLAGIKKKEKRVIMLWLLLYPIPAALTGPGYCIRSIIGAPIFAILSSFGVFTLAVLFKSRKAKIAFSICAVFIVLYSITSFAKHYFIDYARYTARGWLYGVREAMSYAEKNKGQYDNIVVSDYIRGAPILVLFYTKYPPRERQLDLKKGLDFNMGKYRISPISKNLNIEGRSLFIVKSYETDNIAKELYNLSVRHVIMDPYDNKELLTLLEAVKR